jgi:alpha-galactosidase
MKRGTLSLVFLVALRGAIPVGGAEPPKTEAAGKEAVLLLTPPAPPEPRINGPKVYGVRHGVPFLYRIPATGQRPMTFAAEGLPQGLTLDPATGIVSGRVKSRGEYPVTLVATNARGQAKRQFCIMAFGNLALTPPMGWNSWYIHYERVNDKIMREAAEQMIASGMADYGYQYVNIDEGWSIRPGDKNPDHAGPPRNPDGSIRPNRRFPDMKALTDYIHAKGLKAGLHTSPGETDCGGNTGCYGHEAQNARTFAQWGFDFLKYDWCSYGAHQGGNRLANFQRPYRLMWGELQKLDRDVVFNLCQYGMADVWTWGGNVGHCWRTTGDLGCEKAEEMPGFFIIGRSNAQHWQFARPGAWNDPDYILIGWVGDAFKGGLGEPTKLTAPEQYLYMSMWSLMAAPLIFSGDMAKLDALTLNVLSNHEVIDVDQDPLGRQARIVRQSPTEMVLAKDLEDGSQAIGLFNLRQKPAKVSVTWAELGLQGPQRVHDLWRQKDLNNASGTLEIDVPRHGAAMLRLEAAKLEKRG